jgi:acylphosphatase
MIESHRIIITGKVQDVGFRDTLENIGRSFGLPGEVFNQKDGSVKILCGGEESIIEKFMQAIRERGERNGAEIESFDNQIIPLDISDLPEIFSKISADDEINLGRKFDIANVLLKDGFESLNTRFESLNTDLNTGFNELKIGINNLSTIMLEQMEYNKEQREYNKEQRAYNVRMDEHNTRLEAIMYEQNTRIDAHNTRLEKILEKLVDKA